MRRVVRRRSLAPRCCSSCASRLLTAGSVTCSSRAAAVRLPLRTNCVKNCIPAKAAALGLDMAAAIVRPGSARKSYSGTMASGTRNDKEILEAAVDRLERLAKELKGADLSAIKDRWDDRISALQRRINDALADTLGD